MAFTTQLYLRWSDIDANYHLRHSVYYDFGAQHRIEILESVGLTMAVMQEQNIGPVLFREEGLYKREIRLNDTVFITSSLAAMREDASRVTIRHELTGNNHVFAIITVDGAWMDTKLRKLLNPIPQIIKDAMSSIPKSTDFNIIAVK